MLVRVSDSPRPGGLADSVEFIGHSPTHNVICTVNKLQYTEPLPKRILTKDNNYR